ncbi:hypothetical protein OPKNFCMD_5253 [Methylobacterium crusticola]|uniref:Toprim domain-containing protein n=2 Tax=Methylobacterium crusticola TaxID=1697972 RepID=A0ABQ4R4X4_9HYPH|nr:hypothetical protein OPKNFCMD_5253 [Methylobacterium crusticola]
MVALVVDIRSNVPLGVHRTAIDHEGRKATVNGKSRLALGPIGGGAVKLTPDEQISTCVAICEGIETTLSMHGLPEFGESPIWSVLSANGIKDFPVLPGVECLWVGVDADAAGIAAAEACAERWVSAGRDVILVQPDVLGADLNDLTEVAR